MLRGFSTETLCYNLYMSYKPISESQLEALLAPFEPGQLYWQKLEEVAEMARWQVVLHREALFERLDNVLALGWGFRLEVVSPLPAVVVAHLELGSSVRSGLGEGLSLADAQIAALSQAALAYGIAHDDLFQPHQWHTLDWKAKAARATEAEHFSVESVTQKQQEQQEQQGYDSSFSPPAVVITEVVTPVPAPAALTPLEPEKPKHQKAIDDLMDELREMGLELDCAKIMLKYNGYGKDLDESRKLYTELNALKKKHVKKDVHD
jgi:hypothetical protein